MLYTAGAKSPFKGGSHDPDTVRNFGIIFQPPTWSGATVYKKQDDDNYDVVIPTTFTGLYHRAKYPGISGMTEPQWATVPGDETVDGTTGLVWIAELYNLMPVGETIYSATVESTGDVTLSGTTYSDGAVDWTWAVLADDADARTTGYFDTLCSIVKSNGETVDCTIRLKLQER